MEAEGEMDVFARMMSFIRNCKKVSYGDRGGVVLWISLRMREGEKDEKRGKELEKEGEKEEMERRKGGELW